MFVRLLLPFVLLLLIADLLLSVLTFLNRAILVVSIKKKEKTFFKLYLKQTSA
jgi:hypothetical protein